MNILGRLIPLWLVALVCFTAGVTTGGGAMRVWYKGDIADLKRERAENEAAGSKILAVETQKIRDREAEIAKLNLELEEQSGKDKAAIAVADGRTDDALKRVRAAERAARGCSANNQSNGAAVNSESTAGSWDRLSEALDNDHRDCARSANILASYARSCHTFAIENCKK